MPATPSRATIVGLGGLTLNGGTETLSGNNSYSGLTAVNSGTLALSGSGSIDDSSGVSVAGPGNFSIAATTFRRLDHHA